MAKDKNSGVEQATLQNILALWKIRDNAAHLINKDLYIRSPGPRDRRSFA